MKEQPGFRPLNDDHAIESVKFTVHFTSAITPPAILAVDRGHDLWREALPARSISDVEVDVGGRQLNAPGVMFAFVKPDASPTWSMHVGGNRIEIECFLYSRWARVWAAARENFVNVLEILSTAQEKLMVSMIDLTVKDVFVGAEGHGSLTQLLQPNSLLPEAIFARGSAWHSHTGWITSGEPNIRTIHNLNLDAVPSNGNTYINATHYQMRNTGQDLPVSSVAHDGFGRLEVAFSELHAANKTLMQDLLSAEMSTRIGLKD